MGSLTRRAAPAALVAVLAAAGFSAPAALGDSASTPSPDPAPTTTTTTTHSTTTARPTTVPQHVVVPPPPSTTTHTATVAAVHTTTTQTATHHATSATPAKPRAAAKRHTAPKPAVHRPPQALKPIARIAHTAPTAVHVVDRKPVVAPVVAAAPASDTGSSSPWRLLVLLAALLLLGASLVPTGIVTNAGIDRAHAASIRVGLAVAGLSVVCGFLIALMLSRSS